jgi:acyl-CoA synthetase (AMP-forming)/AMP-acid ligase II
MKTEKPLTEVEVLDFLKGRLAKVEVPKNVAFADPLPRNAAGKVFKNILGAKYF